LKTKRNHDTLALKFFDELSGEFFQDEEKNDDFNPEGIGLWTRAFGEKGYLDS